MKQLLRTICSLCLLILANVAAAQLYVDAGNDTTICKGNTISLGNSGIQQAYYQWQPSTGLNLTNVANPLATPLVTTTYMVTATYWNGDVYIDSITVRVKSPEVNISATDTNICPGEEIQLFSNSRFSTCNTAECTDTNSLSVIKLNNTSGGTYMLGTNYKGARYQMLYTASELLAALGGPCMINSIGFNLTVFNNGTPLPNFNVEMGCGSLIYIDSFRHDLISVYTNMAGYLPHAGWNNIPLTTPIYWDGNSSLLIGICYYNPNSPNVPGGGYNLATYSLTSASSFIYSLGNSDLCDGTNSAINTLTAYRPDIKLGYCANVQNINPVNSLNFNWLASPGLIAFSNPQLSNQTVSPNISGTYYLHVTDQNGCESSDSVNVDVGHAASLTVENSVCPGVANGIMNANVNINGIGMDYYFIYGNDTIRSGYLSVDSILQFTNLKAGTYRLFVVDSICNNGNYSSTIASYPAMTIAGLNIDHIVCTGDSLGGACITLTGGTAPYSTFWDSSHINTLCYNTIEAGTHIVTVRDSNGCIKNKEFQIHKSAMPHLKLLASDTMPCYSQEVQLTSNDVLFRYKGGNCLSNPILSSKLGSDSLAQPGGATQAPCLFGNFLRSNHSQMLYKANELQTILGGPALIDMLKFGHKVFNSYQYMANMSVKVGFAHLDSLVSWYPDLITVYTSNNFAPSPGWQTSIPLNTPIYWDGVSDMIIDVCNYNLQTFGNQNNKAECSFTHSTQYIHSTGSTNQCNAGQPLKYNLRPNIRFSYCNSFDLIPLSNFDYTWSVSSNLQEFANGHDLTQTIAATETGTYYLSVTDDNGCEALDSIYIPVTPLVTYSTISIFDDFCSNETLGSIAVEFNSQEDSLLYFFLSADYLDTIQSGIVSSDSLLFFQQLGNGSYHVQIGDSTCGLQDFPVTLSSHEIVNVFSNSITPVYCYGDSTGMACISVLGGIPPYIYLWDSLEFRGECYDSLEAGTHFVIVIDSLGCSKVSNPFNVWQTGFPLAPVFNFMDLSLTISSFGGTPPYLVNWGDSSASNVTTSTSFHAYSSSGVYIVTVTDYHGCSSTDTLAIGYNSINDLGGFNISLYPNPANDKLFIQSKDIELQSVNIYNTLGALVMSSLLPAADGVSVAALPAGAYIAEIKTKEGVVKMRWLKQ
ncbi:MAG TPA: T9SS type A sorting domain-containing protein [Chitinophagales bacterium]|nr:T9SS type A sorting domain-containing protein [Chitinophagales bacterium]